mgnify:CR=1 FL=1
MRRYGYRTTGTALPRKICPISLTASTWEKNGKSGIGLALTREIIHMHKGMIRAYNGDGGAVFEISIPVSR